MCCMFPLNITGLIVCSLVRGLKPTRTQPYVHTQPVRERYLSGWATAWLVQANKSAIHLNAPFYFFFLLLCLHFMTVSALTSHRYISACAFRKYVKTLKKQKAQLSLATIGEITFKTICLPAGYSFPSMVLSQRHQFQHNTMHTPNGCTGTDQKIPGYKLGVAPVFINSDITEILKFSYSTHGRQEAKLQK